MTNARKLQLTTPSPREVVITRILDAPRHLVFKAYTTPELLKRWMGPREWEMTVCEIDLRVGGRYRYVWRGPEGMEMGMGGVFREIARPERIVNTEAFIPPMYSGEAQDTMVLTEQGGTTTVTITVLYPSREARDMMLKTPMEAGMNAGFARLDELLASATEAA